MPLAIETKTVASNTGASANNLTFPAVSGQTFYLGGFNVSGLGATGASTIQITITGSQSTNTPTWNLVIPAGTGTAITPLQQSFGEKGMAAAAPNSALTVNVPSFGAGNTTANALAFGFYA